MNSLQELGWGSYFQQRFDNYMHAGNGDSSSVPGRIAACHRGEVDVLTGGDHLRAAYDRPDKSGGEHALPTVGDWVVLQPGAHPRVVHVLERRSLLARKTSGGRSHAQLVAANVDRVFVVTSLNNDFSLRRIERFLAAVYAGGAEPVLLLSKADLCPDPASYIDEVHQVAAGARVLTLSAVTGEGLDDLDGCLQRGSTCAFVGSSGVGKSTLINALLGSERQEVNTIRHRDDRGMHTTTTRELVPVPGDRGVLIDTPGMREFQPWNAEAGIEQAFADIDELAGSCRYRDCRHDGEPGCAVQAAIDDGRLSEARLRNRDKLERELEYQRSRDDARLRRERQQAFRKRTSSYRKSLKRGRNYEW